jgi:hypothetical protein
MRLFFEEISDLCQQVKLINKEAIVVHSIRQAEKEMKDEFLKMMALK